MLVCVYVCVLVRFVLIFLVGAVRLCGARLCVLVSWHRLRQDVFLGPAARSVLSLFVTEERGERGGLWEGVM